MKFTIWLGLMLGLLAGHAGAATNSGNSLVGAVGVLNGNCVTWPSCPTVPNDAQHVFYGNVTNLPTSAPGASASTAVVVQGVAGGVAVPISGTVTSTPSGTQAISAVSLPLPAGAATSANQPVLNGDGGAPAHVTNFPGTQPVSATALPLPSGAATDAHLTGVQSAPGTPQAEAVTVQGNAGGVPLPAVDINSAAFTTALTMTAGGSAVAVGRSVELLCTAAGNVSLQLGGSPHVIAVQASPASYTIPYSVTAINSSGTTATCTYANLY